MRKRWIGFCLVLLTANPAGATDLGAEIDRIVGSRVRAEGPGAAVLVMRDGRPVAKRAYGRADIATRRPVTSRTRFDLASVSKPLTALVILRLAERGRLGVDDAVAAVLPEFRVPAVGRAVTLRDLLQHTSGLRDYTNDFPGSDREFARLTTRSHVEWLNGTRAKRPPGQRFEYNNSNYALLARVAEVAGGGTFARLARSELFRRAGVRGAFVYQGGGRLPPDVATGYIVQRGQIRPSSLLTDVPGDGNFYLSIDDLAKVIAALPRGRIVRARTLREAWRNGRFDDGRPIRSAPGGYGLGWETAGAVRSHDGSWFGTSTYLAIDTANGTAVAVLSNDESFDALGAGRAILRAANR